MQKENQSRKRLNYFGWCYSSDERNMLPHVTLEASVLGTLESHRSRGKGPSMKEQAVLWALDCLRSQAALCLQCAVHTKISMLKYPHLILQGTVPLYCLDFFCMSYNPAPEICLEVEFTLGGGKSWRSTVTSVYLN